MPLTALTIGNFKGISANRRFAIRPITLFIGPNSSGKSSCLHGLACLAQTVKIPSSTRPLILDDEYAQVHLGRFIEVIHSKSYKDRICLGIEVSQVGDITEIESGKALKAAEEASIEYHFKSTLRTQDISLEHMTIRIPRREVAATRKGQTYLVTDSAHSEKFIAYRREPFFIWPAVMPSPTKEWLDSFQLISAVQNLVARHLRVTLYLGPFRQPPQRPYPTRGATPNEVGSMGELSVPMLANELISSSKRPHIEQVGAWLTALGLAKRLELSRVGKSDQFYANVELKDGARLPIADLGYGVSQVLPVLVQCSFAPSGSTLLFEQPELHLHHGAARMIAKVFVETVRDKNARIIAETHSRELFYQVFQEIRDGHLSVDDVAAYEVKRVGGESVFSEIELEYDGRHLDVMHPWGKSLDIP